MRLAKWAPIQYVNVTHIKLAIENVASTKSSRVSQQTKSLSQLLIGPKHRKHSREPASLGEINLTGFCQGLVVGFGFSIDQVGSPSPSQLTTSPSNYLGIVIGRGCRGTSSGKLAKARASLTFSTYWHTRDVSRHVHYFKTIMFPPYTTDNAVISNTPLE